ncbi:MAG: hypothetical protein HZB50_15015 [Chloroflexi bacterium]|nr:hypothetical protein [Chloroflexota bacterium]
MTVHTQPDYQIKASTPTPDSYPSGPMPDSFSEEPFLPDYESRRRAFFEHILKNPTPANTKAAWHELARLAAGGVPHEGIFHAALDFIDVRKDCSDFVLHGIVRLLYQFGDRGQQTIDRPRSTVSGQVLSRARATVLNFKYFPNEPGIDSLCTWTENHYILFTSAAYLAGQMYPDEVFTNSGETGKQKVELNRKRILRWLDLRFHTGFSEWLSHVYYDEDLTALLALYDFAEDEEIRHKAEMILDLLVFDMALNSFKGVFGSTHGRAYENTKKWASNEGTTDTSKLLFGTGVFSGFDNMSAIAFALSNYRVPEVIETIANDSHLKGDCHLENRQRMGIKLNEMEKWGLHPDNFEDGMLYLTLEAYLHPRTIANTIKMFDTCNWWENSFLNDFKPYRVFLKAFGALGGLPLLARFLERDVCRNTREEVNIYTYKTSDYMLSTAQDYRKGFGGDQQHIWQATLGADAVCFTTHPAKIEGVTPNYWAGNGILPKAAQYKNVAIIIYNIEKIPALYVPIRHFFTHAWLPKDKFDEVIEKKNWIFARKGDGYLALRSRNPYFWTNDDMSLRASDYQRAKQSPVKQESANDGRLLRRQELASRTPAPSASLRECEADVAGGARDDIDNEVIANGAQNIWICQMGCKAEDGEFAEFVEKVSAAGITFRGMNVEYQSPGIGSVRFGWDQALSVDNVQIQLNDYRRYENPYSQTEFNADEIKVTAGEHALTLNWKTGERKNQ